MIVLLSFIILLLMLMATLIRYNHSSAKLYFIEVLVCYLLLALALCEGVIDFRYPPDCESSNIV